MASAERTYADPSALLKLYGGSAKRPVVVIFHGVDGMVGESETEIRKLAAQIADDGSTRTSRRSAQTAVEALAIGRSRTCSSWGAGLRQSLRSATRRSHQVPQSRRLRREDVIDYRSEPMC